MDYIMEYSVDCYGTAHANVKNYTKTDTGNQLIVIPGLGCNSASNNLTKSFIKAGIESGYSVYSIDTFLGDFYQKNLGTESAKQLAKTHTMDYLVKSIDVALDWIKKYELTAKYTCIVAHSSACAGLIRVLDTNKYHTDSCIMFAPFIANPATDEQTERYRDYMINRWYDADTGAIRFNSELKKDNTAAYTSRSFIDDMMQTNIDKMPWDNTSIRIITAAQRDLLVPQNAIKNKFSGKPQIRLSHVEHNHFFTALSESEARRYIYEARSAALNQKNR